VETQSAIRAFQSVLSTFKFIEPSSFSEDFAIKRFQKKFQVPSDSSLSDASTLSEICWDNYITNDEALPSLRNIPPEWYKARDFLHRNLGTLKLEQPHFPKGSEFSPTGGKNSIEARLAVSNWTSTYENFEAFSKLCYNHMALKRAVRRRYNKWYARKGFDITRRQADAYLYTRFSKLEQRGMAFAVFSWKLRQITTFVQGGRFATVPKNNEKVRPINIEPFANILTQKQVGDWIRHQIEVLYGLDLDRLADVHRIRIKHVDCISTIDLKDASDSISMDLCRFLLPGRLYNALVERRCSMTLGHDRNYHVTRKISSMGNGFTFELMSLILVTICRVLDPDASVFGDDIIIATPKAARLMELLVAVGLKVNNEKSFTDGPFRESCGGNYHRDEGYIESYDFEYPITIGDCVLTWNKVVRLAPIYPSFQRLYDSLFRVLPEALQGGPCREFQQCDTLELVGHKAFRTSETRVTFPMFFVTHRLGKSNVRKLSKEITEILHGYQLEPHEFQLVPGFEFKSELRTRTLQKVHPNRHWAKYLMYLQACRVSKDVLSGSGEWVKVWYVKSAERTFRCSSLLDFAT
jgi:hypothetical protein